MMVLKAGAISTLDIIAGIKQKVIDVKDQMPDALKIGFIGDQSVFVRSAIEGVAFEGVIAALLTSVMILLFLGSWRSTVIIAVSIPLSVLGAIIMLDLAIAAINHGKGLDLALAAGLGDEVRHLAPVAVGFRLHTGVLRQRLVRRLTRQHQCVVFCHEPALSIEQAKLAALA